MEHQVSNTEEPRRRLSVDAFSVLLPEHQVTTLTRLFQASGSRNVLSLALSRLAESEPEPADDTATVPTH